VDLAELSFIDCAGSAALASARREAREAGGDLLLAAAAQPVARLLSLIGELPLFATVSEAASGDPQAPAAVSLVLG
jgi:anti-anti-sigma factor